MEGSAAATAGTFTFSNPSQTDNVAGYLFSMDDDLSSTQYSGTGYSTVTAGQTPALTPHSTPAGARGPGVGGARRGC